jgi:pimeloyl-ACP methyl ester carboxylesterase
MIAVAVPLLVSLFVAKGVGRYGCILWGILAATVVAVRGAATGTVVDDDDEAELRRRQPSARVELVDGAGHSIQGDQPVVLAALLADFLTA